LGIDWPMGLTKYSLTDFGWPMHSKKSMQIGSLRRWPKSMHWDFGMLKYF